jgi:hypothetical protein
VRKIGNCGRDKVKRARRETLGSTRLRTLTFNFNQCLKHHSVFKAGLTDVRATKSAPLPRH